MFKLKKEEVKALFDAIDLDYALNTDEVIFKENYEAVLKIGTVEIDVSIEIKLDHDDEITLNDVVVDFTVFDNGEEIPHKIEDLTHYMNLLEGIKEKIKSILNN